MENSSWALWRMSVVVEAATTDNDGRWWLRTTSSDNNGDDTWIAVEVAAETVGADRDC